MNKNQIIQNRSFRDPSGSVLIEDTKVLRRLDPQVALKDLNYWKQSPLIKKWMDRKQLISFTLLKEDTTEIILEHPKIAFPSYPYEWCASMLFDAGLLTIKLAQDLLDEGLGLKDATPYNILFQGSLPIFIDLPSIEIRDPSHPLWLAYAQFTRMFLLPLYLHRYCRIPLAQIFLTNADGVEYSDCVKFAKKTSPLAFSLIFLPLIFSKSKNKNIYKTKKVKNLELSSFILKRLLKKGEKQLYKVKPKPRKNSRWSSYFDNLSHYSEESFQKKVKFVEQILEEHQLKKVLDVGCNTGHFSVMAAKKGSEVVAIDSDPVVIERLYNHAKKENLSILPLAINLSRPTPSVGWMNKEYFSFLQRAEKQFDLTMMLAVIHHLLVTDRIPMEEIVKLTQKITRRYLILEFIEQKDPMFLQLTRGRENLYRHITFSHFKEKFFNYFTLIHSLENYHPTRKILLLEKKS